MVSATTMDSITWTWNAVEGALGYAVQVSHDEMFDDTDMTHPTTETTFTASDLEPETSVFVRVRAAAGTVEAPLVSAWTTHVTGMSAMPPPPPPAPMAAPTPTGLMSESGDGSITWSWEAVDGADGYAVQVSMDEMFDDMDETMYPMETSHTVEDLDYSETRFARVASTSGVGDDMLMSMWTTHVTGMSNAEPPPPPLPPPSVTFSLPDGESHFMVADDDDDEKTAMAWLNPKTTVDSDSTAIITPMWMEGASGVNVVAASDNMPFTHVGAEDNWELLQSAVLDGGATFMVQRITLGANQEMEPTNTDVSYITCGPFECQEGMDPPMISIANSTVCNAWDPEATLVTGLIDNDVFRTEQTEAADSNGDFTNSNDGIDVGWETSSSASMTVKHKFSGVDDGENYDVSGPDAAKGTGKSLKMDRKNTSTAATNENNAYRPGIRIAVNDTLELTSTTSACFDDATYDENVGGNHQPNNCFRLTATGGANYLSGYSIEVSAKDSAVSWGEVDWKHFEDFTCEAVTFSAMDSLDTDICEIFAAEVDYALSRSNGWGGRRNKVWVQTTEQTEVGTTQTGITNHALVTEWRVGIGAPLAGDDTTTSSVTEEAGDYAGVDGDRFTTLWFDDDLDGKIRKSLAHSSARRGGPTDLYNQNQDATNVEYIHQTLVDKDNDPTRGDFGKVDLISAKDNPGTPVNETEVAGNPDGKADNYAADDDAYACSDDDGGDGCDAKWEETFDVLFADGIFGCSETRSVTISCEWDAQGGLEQGRSAASSEFNAANVDSFAKCTVN